MLRVSIIAIAGLLLLGLLAAGGGSRTSNASGQTGTPGQFAPGIDIGLDAEQLANATISLQMADVLHAGELPVLAMVVSALGESGFRVVPNGQGSGYCGVFQADPANIPCDDTKEQARRFQIGGKGFQAGGAMALAKAQPDLSPGTIATRVEASGQPGAFYDVHQQQARTIISAWRAGAGKFPAAMQNEDATAVLANKNIFLTPGQRADMESGGLDSRLLSTLAWLGENHEITISALRKDHAPGTNHEAGRAADIAIVDKWICRGGRDDPCADAVRELARVQGPNRSTELIYCWDPDLADPNMFARADHCDHIHVGWDGPLP